MWLDEQRTRVVEHRGPVVFMAPPEFGASQIIDSLRPTTSLIWIELFETDQNDATALGNRLGSAVKQALGSAILPSGLPFYYSIHFLKEHLDLLGPFTFALSNAGVGTDLAEALLQLADDDNRVLLEFHAPPDMVFPERALLLTDGDLHLEERHALEEAAGRLPASEVKELYSVGNGAYFTVLTDLNERLGLGLPQRSSPSGPHLPPGREIMIEAEVLLEVLRSKERWIDALELAVSDVPEDIIDVLQVAGHHFHAQGLHGRLATLLDRVPRPKRSDEVYLRWRLTAAARLNRLRPILPTVEAYLALHEAPELRAVYASLHTDAHAREREAERAYRAAQTPLTLFQYGRLHRSLEEGVRLLRDAVTLAEFYGYPYEVARNAGTLAAQLVHLGRYREAVHWGAWALEYIDHSELSDGYRRLRILNTWAFSSLLIGSTVGLEAPLREAESQLSLVPSELGRLSRSTLGDVLMVAERPAEALHYYRQNWDDPERRYVGAASLTMTRALLELSEPEAALEIAEQAFFLTKHESLYDRQPAALAYAMALALDAPERAAELLDGIVNASTRRSARYVAQAALYRALIAHRRGAVQRCSRVLETASWALSDLSYQGLKLLSGPSDLFMPVWQQVQVGASPLQLTLLGGFEAYLDGRRLPLSPLQADIVTLLSLQQRTAELSLEQLMLMLKGDEGSAANLRASLSKLRSQLPISRHPYQLQVASNSDAEALLEHLKAGQVRDALSLYRGPLLPNSEAPGIAEAREGIEEALRQAVLASGDAEALIALAERLGDDLELWETARNHLDDNDNRTPLVRARIDRILKSWHT